MAALRKKSSSATPGSQSCASSATKSVKPRPDQHSNSSSTTTTTGTTDTDTICPDCQLVVDDQSKAIECEVCDRWYHTSCQNISNALYQVLICEETTNISWYCKSCNQGAKSSMKKICKLNERQERVENGLVMLTELHQNLNDRIISLGSSLEARMKTQEKVTEERFSTMESVFTLRIQNLETQSVDGAADMAREMEDRQDRENNIIMFNVPESSAGSRVEQVDDTIIVKKMCVILGADNAQIITRRVGRKTETGNRPIRVEITDITNKKTILKNARHPREEDDLTLRNVFISQDLTPSQREEQKELRRRRKTMLEELQEKGITNTTVIIRKGQLYKVKKKRSGTGGGDPGRVGAQKQKHAHSSTRTCSNLRSFYTNIDSFVNKREEFLKRIDH